jgi:hypothetical protein
VPQNQQVQPKENMMLTLPVVISQSDEGYFLDILEAKAIYHDQLQESQLRSRLEVVKHHQAHELQRRVHQEVILRQEVLLQYFLDLLQIHEIVPQHCQKTRCLEKGNSGRSNI